MHSQCQTRAIEISCDIAEFRDLLWTPENVYKTSDVRVEILTEADGFTTLICRNQFQRRG
jgi:hypothetical protein